jgi:glycine cleavage system aminomethyltransferase T
LRCCGGRRAGPKEVLNCICANDVAVPLGRIVYTQWLNERGTIEADLTVTRLAQGCYLLVARDAQYRQHVSSLTSADMSNEAFPYLTMAEIDIGHAPVKALRITFVGELGWELYVPTEFTLHAFDRLVEAGADVGLRHAGFQALNTLRLEKAYRDYGYDIDNTDTPLEVGLGFAVDLAKPGGFVGREAFLRQKEEGILQRRLVQFLLEDPEPLLYGSEPIYRDGERVGYLGSGGYGHTLGGAVGLGHIENAQGVTSEFVESGRCEIQVAGVLYPARASLRPLYDPKGERVRS